jgi:Cyclic nucleotide-binding domain
MRCRPVSDAPRRHIGSDRRDNWADGSPAEGFMHFGDIDHFVENLIADQLAHVNFAAAFGFIGAGFYVITYYMRTMVPLRVIGIIANLFFLAYGYFYPSYPTFLLYLGILPINVVRLLEMRRLIQKVKESTRTDLSMDWLKPFMKKRTYKKGAVLFRKGDRAYEMYYVVAGQFLVTEIGVTIPAGQVFGELGFLAPENRRTSSVECVETGAVLTITYDKVQELYFQNPTFGFYFLRLTTERLLQNIMRLEASLAKREASAAQPEQQLESAKQVKQA